MRGEKPTETFHCPECARPMVHVHTVWRGFAPTIHTFRCEPCGVTIRDTETGKE